MDLEIFNYTKKILNNSIIDTKWIENKHLIFIKYTSDLYYKYTIELLETLCQKSKYENKKLLFHTCLNFLLKILYNCGNIPCLNNYDLLILCSFSLGIKSTEYQHKSPSLNKLKKIYPEKFSSYENEDIKLGEVICIKLLNYNINILTSYECLFYLLNKNNNLFLLDYCINELDIIIFQGAKNYVFKRPIDIAKETIEKAKFKEKQRKSVNKVNGTKPFNNSKVHYNNKNNNKQNMKSKNILPNNESISTNSSSAANISNWVNNNDKQIYYSFKSKSIIKNKLKDINNSRKKATIIDDDENEEKDDKKLKINFIYNNIDNNENYSPEKPTIFDTNNNKYENKVKLNKMVHFKNSCRKRNNGSITKLETIDDNNKTSKGNIIQLKKFQDNSSSPDIFRKPVKVYKKSVKFEFSENSKKNKGEKIKNLINYKIKNNIINNRINNNYKINNNMNFNYDKLNELCNKMNFDVFNKNELNV